MDRILANRKMVEGNAHRGKQEQIHGHDHGGFLGVGLGEIVRSEHPESDEVSGGNKKK